MIKTNNHFFSHSPQLSIEIVLNERDKYDYGIDDGLFGVDH